MHSSVATTHYPEASGVEERLKRLAVELGDIGPKPFRVDVVRVNGGKPPIYSVVIRSSAKEPLRAKLERLLNRPLTCGISSFMLKAEEVNKILNRAQPGVDLARCLT